MDIRIEKKTKVRINRYCKMNLNVLRLWKQEKTLSEIGKILGIHPSLSAKIVRKTLKLHYSAKIVNLPR